MHRKTINLIQSVGSSSKCSPPRVWAAANHRFFSLCEACNAVAYCSSKCREMNKLSHVPTCGMSAYDILTLNDHVQLGYDIPNVNPPLQPTYYTPNVDPPPQPTNDNPTGNLRLVKLKAVFASVHSKEPEIVTLQCTMSVEDGMSAPNIDKYIPNYHQSQTLISYSLVPL
jgi:hypothetical protein